jgi:hypothetical protein
VKRLRRAAETGVVVASDLIYASAFVSGSRRLAAAAKAVESLRRFVR